MKVVSILNKNNDYQRFEVLKHNRNKRYKYNQFIVEGVRSLNEAVKNNWKIISFIYDKNNLSGWAKHMIETVKTEVNYTLTAQLLKELSGKEETSELLAIIEMREDRLENVALSSNPFIVLFDRPSNKGNLGTMIRSCDALGVDMLIITGHAVDLYEPDVIVSAMGSFFNLPVIRIIHNEDLYKFVESLRIFGAVWGTRCSCVSVCSKRGRLPGASLVLIKKGVLYAKKIWAGRNGPVEWKSPGGLFRGGCVPLHGGNGGGAAKAGTAGR